MSVDILSLICTVICLIYYCVLKKEKPLLEYMFRRKPKENQVEIKDENCEI